MVSASWKGTHRVGWGKRERRWWIYVLTELLTIPKVLGLPKGSLYQEKCPHIFCLHKMEGLLGGAKADYPSGAATALHTVPTPISPPPVDRGSSTRCWACFHHYYHNPTWAREGESWDAAAQCPPEWSMEDWSLGQLDLAWEPGAGRNYRNSNKPTEANPRGLLPCTSSSPSPGPSSVFFQGPPDAPLTHLPRNLGSGLSFLASPQAADTHSVAFQHLRHPMTNPP